MRGCSATASQGVPHWSWGDVSSKKLNVKNSKHSELANWDSCLIFFQQEVLRLTKINCISKLWTFGETHFSHFTPLRILPHDKSVLEPSILAVTSSTPPVPATRFALRTTGMMSRCLRSLRFDLLLPYLELPYNYLSKVVSLIFDLHAFQPLSLSRLIVASHQHIRLTELHLIECDKPAVSRWILLFSFFESVK